MQNNIIKAIILNYIIDDDYNNKPFIIYKIKYISSIKISNRDGRYYIEFKYKEENKYMSYKIEKERDIKFQEMKQLIEKYYNGIVYNM